MTVKRRQPVLAHNLSIIYLFNFQEVSPCSHFRATLPTHLPTSFGPTGRHQCSNFQDSYQWTHSQETQRKLVSAHEMLSNTVHRQHLASTAHTAFGNQKRGWGVSKVALYPRSYPWLSCNNTHQNEPISRVMRESLRNITYQIKL